MKRNILYNLMSLCLVAVLFCVAPQLATSAYASTNGHTRSEAVTWAKNKEGTSDKFYSSPSTLECMDLAGAYYQYLGHFVSGLGCPNYIINNTNNRAGERASSDLDWTMYDDDTDPLPGDLVLWENSYTGHIGIIVEVYSNSFKYIDYNGDKKHCGGVIRSSGSLHDFDRIIRPDFEPEGEEMTVGYDRVLPDGDYIIAASANPYYYLDIEGGDLPAPDRKNVQLWHVDDFEDIHAPDIWTITYDSSNKFYKIRQKGTNMCLDVAGSGNTADANVQVFHDNSDYKTHYWAISRAGDKGYRIQSRSGTFSLDMSTGLGQGVNVRQWKNTESSDEKWLFIPYQPSQPIEEGRYVLLYTPNMSYEMDVSGDTGDIANSTPVQIWEDTAQSQFNSFDFIKLSNGYYKIRHAASGMCLDVTNGSSNYKSTVAVYQDNGTVAQQWAVVENGIGYSLISRCNGYALDLADGNTTRGKQLEVYPRFGNDHQRWTFVQAEYIVQYNLNGGAGTVVSQTKYYHNPLTLTNVKPTRENYNFLGWATSASATTVQYQPGDTYNTDADLTLYAVWERIGNTITYNANGGENPPAEQFKAAGETITLSSDIPTRTGYTFMGWGTSASATTARYQPGASYSADADLTLFALWRITNPPTLHGKNVTMLVGDTRDLADLVELTHDGVLSYTLKATAGGVVSLDGQRVTATAPGNGALIVSVVEYPSATCTVNINVVDLSNMLRLPAALNAIGDEAFENCGAVAVTIPSGCTTIGSRAFANNPDLVYTLIPASVTQIAANAFANCPNVTIYCYSGSIAATYAAKHSIRYVLLSDGWVLADALPLGATVTDEMWTYQKASTETTTSIEEALEGWTQTGYIWQETGNGTHTFASFPAGFDPGHSLYSSYAKEVLSNYESGNNKREVSASVFFEYIYWHWTFTDYVEDSNRNVSIEDAKKYGVQTGSVLRDYVYFDAFETSLSLSQEGMTTGGLRIFDGIWSTYHHPEYNLPEYASWWWYRFEVYRQTYTDYQKLFTYARTVTSEESSGTPIAEGEGISNVQHWVKYTV